MRVEKRLLLRTVCAMVLLAVANGPRAQWGIFDSDFDEQSKPWSEIESKLPSFPKDSGLIPFEASAATPHRFYIDAASVSVGEDGVVRYTLMVKAAGGATNVSFEGIRCKTREQKLYAIGRAGGSWTRARDPRWRRIEPKDVNAHHMVLFADFFCTERDRMTTQVQILEALRRESASLR